MNTTRALIMGDTYKCFMAALKSKLSEPGITQAKISRAADVKPTYLSMIVNGGRNASLTVQEQIASSFGMSHMEMVMMGDKILQGLDPDETVEQDEQEQKISTDSFMLHAYAMVEEQRKTETELNQLRAIVEHMGEAVCFLDKNFVVRYANQIHRNIFGNTVGKMCSLIHGCDDTSKSCACRKALDTGTPTTQITKHGDLTISIVASPIRDATGAPDGVCLTIRDVTARQKMIDENEALANQLGEALQMIERGVLVYDKDRNITFTNAKYREQTGMTGDEKTVDEIAELQEGRGVKNLAEIRSSMMKAYMERKETSVICHVGDGTQTLYSAKPIFNHDGSFVGILAIISPFGGE